MSRNENSTEDDPKAPVPEPSQPEAPSGTNDLQAQLEAAKKDAAVQRDHYVRALADLENFRRRSIREKDDLRMFGISRVLEELLPVLDNLGLALTAGRQAGGDPKALIGGIDMVAQQLKSALVNHGLKEVNAVGQAFNPHEHEAISHQPSATVPAEHVISVVRAGYTLNGRLLRAAAVVVSSGPEAAEKK